MKSNTKYKIILVLSFLGIVDASYLALKYYIGGTIPCSIVNGCDIVTKSQYATIGPIPIALLGAIYYFSIFILTILYLEDGKNIYLRAIKIIVGVGFIVSMTLLYIQIFTLGALCLYCLISIILTTAMFFINNPWSFSHDDS